MTGGTGAVSHEQQRAQLAELAADVLDGRERAELLEHVDSCPSCALELEELTMAVDSLVQLAGESDPPVGFEARVFERMRRQPARAVRPAGARGGSARSNRSDRSHRPLVAVCVSVAAVAVLAFSLGWAVHPGGVVARRAAPGPVDRRTEAPLLAAGKQVGVVSVYGSTPAWLSMTVESSPWAGSVWCRVTLAGGATRTVGSFSLASGYGAWMAPLPVPASSVRTASLVDPGGQVLAEARFGPGATRV